jgi:cyclophilin family peptidyl-prolyl cis-trans isomerase
VFCRRFAFLLLFALSLACGRAGTLAQFRTIFGDIELELYDQDKPVTVQNFIRYIQGAAYQDAFSHRLVPGFVVQGGGFAVSNRGTTNAGISQIPTFAPITNEFAVGRRFSNVYGTIAMAKLGGNTNSASSQWFINLANNTFLDAPDTNNLFVVFGRVIRGTNVLNILNTFQNYNGTQQSNLVANFPTVFPPNFASCPLLRPVLVETNLLFFDITLLQVAVKSIGGGREISWSSAGGLTNVVEFTTNFPLAWTTLVRTNGNGNRIAVIDSAPNTRRFYRVRVEY